MLPFVEGWQFKKKPKNRSSPSFPVSVHSLHVGFISRVFSGFASA